MAVWVRRWTRGSFQRPASHTCAPPPAKGTHTCRCFTEPLVILHTCTECMTGNPSSSCLQAHSPIAPPRPHEPRRPIRKARLRRRHIRPRPRPRPCPRPRLHPSPTHPPTHPPNRPSHPPPAPHTPPPPPTHPALTCTMSYRPWSRISSRPPGARERHACCSMTSCGGRAGAGGGGWACETHVGVGGPGGVGIRQGTLGTRWDLRS